MHILPPSTKYFYIKYTKKVSLLNSSGNFIYSSFNIKHDCVIHCYILEKNNIFVRCTVCRPVIAIKNYPKCSFCCTLRFWFLIILSLLFHRKSLFLECLLKWLLSLPQMNGDTIMTAFEFTPRYSLNKPCLEWVQYNLLP